MVVWNVSNAIRTASLRAANFDCCELRKSFVSAYNDIQEQRSGREPIHYDNKENHSSGISGKLVYPTKKGKTFEMSVSERFGEHKKFHLEGIVPVKRLSTMYFYHSDFFRNEHTHRIKIVKR